MSSPTEPRREAAAAERGDVEGRVLAGDVGNGGDAGSGARGETFLPPVEPPLTS